jgi:hypothetical protein
MEPIARKRTKKGHPPDGPFVMLPLHVIRSTQYIGLSHASRSLLILVAAQYKGRNNGKLVATPRYLLEMGWNSNNSTSRCLSELMASGLLVRTRMGARPSKAAWYALGWRLLDVDAADGLDEINPNQFKRFVGNKFVIPATGIAKAAAIPTTGIDRSPTIPTTGALEAVS